jgi:hypothetical protein
MMKSGVLVLMCIFQCIVQGFCVRKFSLKRTDAKISPGKVSQALDGQSCANRQSHQHMQCPILRTSEVLDGKLVGNTKNLKKSS